jgi:SH3-like domain-containing protein
MAGWLALGLLATGLGGPVSAAKPDGPPYNRAAGETPSGQPVPRFVSLRYAKVNGRAGPDLSYPVRWVYGRRGLPVRVTAETEEWRRIEDPQGGVVWVHRRTLDGRRTAMVRPMQSLQSSLRRKPASDARVSALLASGVIVDIEDARPGWRKVRVGTHRGWTPAGDLWGGDRGEAR